MMHRTDGLPWWIVVDYINALDGAEPWLAVVSTNHVHFVPNRGWRNVPSSFCYALKYRFYNEDYNLKSKSYKKKDSLFVTFSGMWLDSQLANFSQFWSRFCQLWDQCKSSEKMFPCMVMEVIAAQEQCFNCYNSKTFLPILANFASRHPWYTFVLGYVRIANK